MFEILGLVHRTRVRFGRCAVLGALFLGVIGMLGRGGSGEPAAVAASSRRYVVQAGDTLWRIARLQVGPRMDPRPMIEDIRKANGLPTPGLTPGDTLVLP